jgi:hypothetical protein
MKTIDVALYSNSELEEEMRLLLLEKGDLLIEVTKIDTEIIGIKEWLRSQKLKESEDNR